MTRHPRVTLTQPLEGVLRRGQPWIYADALSHKGVRVSAGDVVNVHARDGSWFARGIIDPDSPIRVRIWTYHKNVEVDDNLLVTRIKQARRRRAMLETTWTTGVRVLHGENDRVPGIVCDRYGSVGVLRPDGVASERWLGAARDCLSDLYPITHWVVRRADIHRGERPRAEWWGDPAPQGSVVMFQEHGMYIKCDVLQGQKTGFFLDQRANRQRVAKMARGKRLLNLFGYTGGFSLAAAMQGAARTTTVDLAAPAIDMARENFELNGFPASTQEFVVADVFEYLAQFDAECAPFEVAVCDPPSFAHKRRDRDRATAAYEELFASLLQVMRTGSIVVLASCSSHISRDAFLGIVARAALAADCALVLMDVQGADVDHPTLPGFLEGDYLQCVYGMIARD